ncbi:hypothetical protein WJX74_010720 [Apatococcus lobatus]|uniref:Germin-like protein n=1 Tax=Apatococcus lobatus TaxID=904363 RepID=A0AAW1RTC1_9CHLO
MNKAFVSFVVLCLAGLAAVGQAQQISPKLPSNFTDLEQEVKQRGAVNYTGFVYSVAADEANTLTPNGNQTTNFIQNNPFLATLPNGGNGQNLLRLGPCAGNTLHTHPRGSEISTVLYGKIMFGMVDENLNEANKLILRNLSQYDTIHIPQGLLHFSFNDNCEEAAFLANFGNRDPGTQSIWNSIMQVPSSILQLSTGIPEALFNLYKHLPLIEAPGTGGEECLKRCGLDLQKVNKLLPNADNPTAAWTTPASG